MESYDVLVGRTGELHRVEHTAAATRAAHGRVTLLAGPAGIGKTRLLTELAQRCDAAGDLVLWGRCSPDPGAPDHWPWIQVVRDCVGSNAGAGLVDRLGPAAAHLARAVPDLAAAFPDAVAEPVEGTGSSFSFYDATVSLLRLAAAEQPTVILIDDAHWADDSSLRLLDLLSRTAADARLLVVVAHRELDAAQDPAIGTRLDALAGRAERIELGGLSPAETRALMTARSGTEPADDLATRVHAVTGGNPFFIDEAVRLLAVERGGDTLEALPRTMLGTISGALQTLPATHRRVLAAAAIAGETFGSPLVAAIADHDVGSTRTLLGDLHRRCFLVPADQPDRWRFAHALLREAVSGALDPAEAATLHRRAGEALTTMTPGDDHVGEVAAHFVAAAAGGPPGPAAIHCATAGRAASRRLAHGEASRWFEQAVQLLSRDASAPETERVEVLLDLGNAQIRAGQAAAALATFDRVRTLAGHVDDHAAFARSVMGTVDARMRGPGVETSLDDLRPLIEQAVERLDEVGATDPALLARLLGHLALCLGASSKAADARTAAARATELAGATDDVAARHAALLGQRCGLLGPFPLTEKQAATDQLLLLAAQTDDPHHRWQAARWRLYDGLEAGDPDLIARALTTTRRVSEQLAEPDLTFDTMVQQGTVAMLEGRWDDLAALHDRAGELAAVAEVAQEPLLGQQLFASRETGDLQIDILRMILEANPLPIYHALVCWGSVNAGRLDDARSDLDRFFRDVDMASLADGVYSTATLAMISEAIAATGQLDRAAEIAPWMRAVADHCVVAGIGPYVWTGSMHHYLGMVETALGDYDAARRHHDEALTVHRRMGARPWILRTRVAQARLAAAEGDHDEARRSLTALSASIAEAGMATLAREVDGDLEALGDARHDTAGETWLLSRQGDMWVVATPRGEHRLRDRKGLCYLAELLSRPKVELHVLDLVGAGGGRVHEGGLGGALDEQSKTAYRRRIEDLRDQIAEGEAWGDSERVDRAREELDAIAHQLAAAVGLGGRDRPMADPGERARVNATKAIRSAIAAIGELAPEIADHLRVSVRTGIYCGYEPDPTGAVTWEIARPSGR